MDYDLTWIQSWILDLPILKYLFIDINKLPYNNNINSIYRTIIKIYHPDFNLKNFELKNKNLKNNLLIDELIDFKNKLNNENLSGEFISFIKKFIKINLTDISFCKKFNNINNTLNELFYNINDSNDIQTNYKTNFNNINISNFIIYNDEDKKKFFTTVKDEKIDKNELDKILNLKNKNRDIFLENINETYKQELDIIKEKKLNFNDVFNDKLKLEENNNNNKVIEYNSVLNNLDKYSLMTIDDDNNYNFEDQFKLDNSVLKCDYKKNLSLDELIKYRENELNNYNKKL